MHSGIHDVVILAEQFLFAVAADAAKRLVDAHDPTVWSSLGHDGVGVDGVHQGLCFT